MHIFGNMYALLFAAIFLEPILGNVRLVFSYLLCGVVAGIASAAFHPHTVGVGASGAIFGLFGILLAYLAFDKALRDSRGAILVNVGVYIGFNLLIGAAIPGVDFIAHIGGLGAGILVGSAFCIWNPIILSETDEPER
jgi:rhomboid protease GluP